MVVSGLRPKSPPDSVYGIARCEQPQADTLHEAIILMWGRGPALPRRAGGGAANAPASALKNYLPKIAQAQRISR